MKKWVIVLTIIDPAINDIIDPGIINNVHSLLHVIDCFWFGSSIFLTSVVNGNELYILLGSLPPGGVLLWQQ